MGRIISFFIPGNPKALQRHRQGKFCNYDPSAPDKADFLSVAYKHRPDKPFSGPLKVNSVFTFQRPKNHFGTGKNANVLKASAPYWKTSKGDLDNLLKFIGDALESVFWTNDSIICSGESKKIYGEVPGTQIDIMELEG